MPITYSVDISTALIVTRCVGRVTLAEVLQHFVELASSVPPVERLDVLLDLSEQTSLPGLQDLEKVADGIEEHIGPHLFGRCAVVTDQEALSGLMQMFEVFAGRMFDAIEVFPTIGAALAWLAPMPKAPPSLTTH